MSDTERIGHLEEALGRAWSGDLAPLGALVKAAGPTTPATRGALLLLERCANALFASEGGEGPAWQDTGAARGAEALGKVAVGHAAVLSAIRALVALDRDGFDTAYAALREVAPGAGAPALTAWVHVLTLWHDVITGNARRAEETADAAIREATQASLGPAVIFGHVARSLALMALGNVVGARAIARRTSRMARTEGQPVSEYVANIILARVRRLSGNPHLATRILTAVRAHAPVLWHPWIAWELTLAGSGHVAADAGTPLPPWCEAMHAYRAVQALGQVEGSAARGDRDGFDRYRAALLSEVRRWHLHEREASVVCVALDGFAPLARTKAQDIDDWFSGGSAETPAVLQGLLSRADVIKDPGDAAAYVFVGPDGQGRRVLHAGVPLLAAAGASVVRSPERAQERREAATAVLALAPSHGIDDAEFFERVYGFPYDRAQHRGTLDTLLHRVREGLGDAATVHREDGTSRLVTRVPFAVPDPRCAEPLPNRILRAVAELDHASAKDIAEKLDVPLRTIQAALRELADDGAFEVSTEGRKHHYRIVDTVFSEPTKH